ncbi:MAG: hypothetical protein EOO41_02310, partial [Methanobacteriota archaeon]
MSCGTKRVTAVWTTRGTHAGMRARTCSVRLSLCGGGNTPRPATFFPLLHATIACRALALGAYLATEVYALTDTSVGLADTHRFLRARIADVDELGRNLGSSLAIASALGAGTLSLAATALDVVRPLMLAVLGPSLSSLDSVLAAAFRTLSSMRATGETAAQAHSPAQSTHVTQPGDAIGMSALATGTGAGASVAALAGVLTSAASPLNLISSLPLPQPVGAVASILSATLPHAAAAAQRGIAAATSAVGSVSGRMPPAAEGSFTAAPATSFAETAPASPSPA